VALYSPRTAHDNPPPTHTLLRRRVPLYLGLCVDLHARVCEEGGHDRGVPMLGRPVQRGDAILQGRGEGAEQCECVREGGAVEGQKGDWVHADHRQDTRPDASGRGHAQPPPDAAARRRVGKPSKYGTRCGRGAHSNAVAELR